MTKPGFTRTSAILLGLCLTLFINYRGFLTDFNLVPGDKGDTRLVVFTLEHWYSALHGQQPPFQLPMFYPDQRALGYADGLFLFAIPYAAFREVGVDYFSSYQLVLVLMTCLGYGAYLLLLRRALRLRPFLAVSGAVLLTSLNALQVQADIGKLIAFHFYPVLIYLLWLYFSQPSKKTWKSWSSLAAFSLLLGLLFFTSYYPAWFFLFSLALFGLMHAILSAARYGTDAVFNPTIRFLRENGIQIAVALVVLLVSLVPFWITYAPVAAARRSFGLVLDLSPTFRDIVNVSNHNYLWSALLDQFHFKYGSIEVQMGSPPIVLGLFAVFLIGQIRAAVWRGTRRDASQDLMLVLSTTAIIIIALIVKFHEKSLWYVVYKLVPGASALRAVGRYLMVFDMLVIVSVMYGLDQLYSYYRRVISGRRTLLLDAGLLLITGALVAEQAHATPFRLNKAEQLGFISSYQKPAGHCGAFFINNVASADLPVGYYQLDAMMTAMGTGIPTINGYSGIVPDEVFAMVPSGIEYKYRILDWLLKNGAGDGICELDQQARAFSPINVASEHQEYGELYRASNLATYDQLFSAAELFVTGQNDLANLHPRYMEEHGYLDPSLGYETGASYKWIADKYWIGERTCGRRQCLGIGIVGSYAEVKDIAEKYRPQATEVYFPFPSRLRPGDNTPDNIKGELLIVFPLTVFDR
jgi:hypothetical protein